MTLACFLHSKPDALLWLTHLASWPRDATDPEAVRQQRGKRQIRSTGLFVTSICLWYIIVHIHFGELVHIYHTLIICNAFSPLPSPFPWLPSPRPKSLPSCFFYHRSFVLLFTYIFGFSYKRNHAKFNFPCLVYFRLHGLKFIHFLANAMISFSFITQRSRYKIRNTESAGR